MRSKGSHGVFAPSALRYPKRTSRCSLARSFRPLRVLRLAASATGGARLRTPYPAPAAGEGPSGQIAACSTRRLGSVTSCYRFAVTQHKMRRRPLESVSSRSLSVRGSWGTAPSVFWFLLYEQKERPGGEPHRLCTLQNQRDADRRLQTGPPPGRRTGRHPPVTPRRRRRPQT